MPTKKRNFTEEFREEAVRLALTSDQPHHDTADNSDNHTPLFKTMTNSQSIHITNCFISIIWYDCISS